MRLDYNPTISHFAFSNHFSFMLSNVCGSDSVLLLRRCGVLRTFGFWMPSCLLIGHAQRRRKWGAFSNLVTRQGQHRTGVNLMSTSALLISIILYIAGDAKQGWCHDHSIKIRYDDRIERQLDLFETQF